jgi:hypothetical protein
MRERLPATTETKNLDVVLAPTVGSALDYGVEARNIAATGRIPIRFIAISCSSPTCALPPTLMSQIGQQCRQANESGDGLSDDICGTASHKIDTQDTRQ